MHDEQFRRLLDFMELSWDGYRKVRKGVKKRIGRHMQSLDCRQLEDYLRLLGAHPEIRRECERLMTVPISRFFRDRHLWQALQSHLLPDIVPAARKHFKVWSAGCACGEEAYSLRILWERIKGRRRHWPVLEILASDSNPQVLEKAQSGCYGISSLKEVPAEIKQQFFATLPGGHRFQILPSLKEGIVWRRHDLMRDPPPASQFDLIFLRNSILTYYKPLLKFAALNRILDCLEPKGSLIVGSHERLPDTIKSLQRDRAVACIYKRIIRRADPENR
jgi:chemotaxis methyl-accepting protein methylase